MGLPTIATDINGCNEIIIPGKNGVLVPSKDEAALYAAMEDFLLHPEKVASLAADSRQLIAERYDRKLIWDALLEEYNVLLKDK